MRYFGNYSSLIGDIGATNIRLAIYYNQKVQKIKEYKCSDFATLDKAIFNYINTELEEDIPVPVNGAIAIACPVIGDQIQMTNHPWNFSITKLKETLRMESLEIVNDFTAVSCALPFFSLSDIHKIQDKGKTILKHPMSVIGPGTGLGAATLVSIGSDFYPLPGEGGHVTMSARNDREGKIIAQLRKNHGLVSFEKILSGQGIINLYTAICQISNEEPEEGLTSEELVIKGTNGESARMLETIEMFCSFLGNMAGNMALTVGSKGGVFIVGNIVNAMKDFLETSCFRESFEDKEGMREYLENIPTYIITHPTPAFVGLKYIINKINE
ncbi:MAG: glucokinase [Alphaproteobacteria bacterium]|nr:glucokinase [Alphaproteobacteria bacterium]